MKKNIKNRKFLKKLFDRFLYKETNKLLLNLKKKESFIKFMKSLVAQSRYAAYSVKELKSSGFGFFYFYFYVSDILN